jgi:hypothetical protein
LITLYKRLSLSYKVQFHTVTWNAATDLLSILNGAPLGVSVAKVYQFLLLARPQSSYALSIHLDHSETQEPLVQHDYLVFIRAIIKDMPVV